MLTLFFVLCAALATAGVRVERLNLGPLPAGALGSLVADTLRASVDDTAPLAQLMHAKTGGNPFFAMQFLKLLERERHLAFDEVHGRFFGLAEAPSAEAAAAVHRQAHGLVADEVFQVQEGS